MDAHVAQPSNLADTKIDALHEEEVDNTPSTLAASTPRGANVGEDDEGDDKDITSQPDQSPSAERSPSSANDVKPKVVIIFDWDDTILPTTTLRNCSRPTTPMFNPSHPLSWGVILDAPELDQDLLSQFEELSALCAETIELTSRFGDVCFITNGSLDWIRTSCQKYMPTLWPTVCHMKRISAKDLVQTQSRDPLQWKKQTFYMQLNEILQYPAASADCPKTVISIGDSLHERHALYHFFETTPVENVAIRSIKFVSLPDVPKLIDQHLALREHFPVIANISHQCRCADLRYHFFIPSNNTHRDADTAASTLDLDEDMYDELPPTYIEETVNEDNHSSSINTGAETSLSIVPNIEAHVYPLVRDYGGIMPPPPSTSEPISVITSSSISTAAAAQDHTDETGIINQSTTNIETTPAKTRVKEDYTIPCKLSRIEEPDTTSLDITNTTSSNSTGSASVTTRSVSTTTTTTSQDDRSTQSVMSSFFNRASLSLSRILGRGSASNSQRSELDASNPFALTPSAKSAAQQRTLLNSVKLSSGNPCLFAHIAGFKYEWQYSPEASGGIDKKEEALA